VGGNDRIDGLLLTNPWAHLLPNRDSAHLGTESVTSTSSPWRQVLGVALGECDCCWARIEETSRSCVSRVEADQDSMTVAALRLARGQAGG